MSFGYSVGDFLAVGQLCWKVYKKCKDSTGNYAELSSEVGALHNVMKETEELLSQQELTEGQRIKLVSCRQGCEGVLRDLDGLLVKYESLGTKSRRTFDRMGFGMQDMNGIRLRLISNVSMLDAFNNVSSHARLETKMNLLIAEVRAGKREGSVVSTKTFDSSAQNDRETWEALRRELEDVGISPAVITEKRQFIIAWFQEAVAAGRLEEDSPSDDDDDDDAGFSSISSDTTLLTDIHHHHHDNGLSPISARAHPAGAAGATCGNGNEEVLVGGIPQNGRVAMPLIPPYPHGTFHADSSGSEIFIGDDGTNSWRPHAGRDAVFPLASSPTGSSDGDSVINRGMSTMALERRETEENPVERSFTENQRSSEQPGRANYSIRGPPSSPPPAERKKKSRLRISYLLSKLGRKDKQLIEAAKFGNVAAVKELLEQGADIESKDKYGETALVWASIKGHVAVVQLLLEQEADIESQKNSGETALAGASTYKQVTVIQLLLDKGADIESKDMYGDTALTRGSKNGHVAVVQLLLDKGADIESKNKHGYTALAYASKFSSVAVVQLLLDKGAMVDTVDITGRTALYYAELYENKAVAQLLRSAGAR